MIKAVKVDWEQARLIVEMDGNGPSREFGDLVWNIAQGDTLHFLYLGDDAIRANFNPRDWRSVKAVTMLVDAAKQELNASGVNGDLLAQVLTDVKKEKSQAAYKEKKKSKELSAVMQKLASRVRNRNYKARKAGLVADLTLGEAERILKSAKGVCPNCLKKGYKWFEFELAHIHHHSEGGGSTASNTRPLCKPCNRGQGATA